MEITSENKTIKKLVSDGLPQGDVLSPTLFNIHTEQFHQKNGKPTIIQYADDFAIIQQAKTTQELQNKLQITLNKFIQEAEKLKLPINTEKTKYMMFGKRSQTISIKIENTNIQRVTNFKYLGTWMDGNLKFKKQIEELKSKARKRLNIIRCICNKNNKLSPKKTITVHRSIIRGILEQGASYTGNASKTLKKSL